MSLFSPRMQKHETPIKHVGLQKSGPKTIEAKAKLLLSYKCLRSCPEAQAEFVPTELLKLHGSQEDNCWRYLMSWKRTSVGEPEVGQSVIDSIPSHLGLIIV